VHNEHTRDADATLNHHSLPSTGLPPKTGQSIKKHIDHVTVAVGVEHGIALINVAIHSIDESMICRGAVLAGAVLAGAVLWAA